MTRDWGPPTDWNGNLGLIDRDGRDSRRFRPLLVGAVEGDSTVTAFAVLDWLERHLTFPGDLPSSPAASAAPQGEDDPAGARPPQRPRRSGPPTRTGRGACNAPTSEGRGSHAQNRA